MSMVLFGGVTFFAAAFRGLTGFGYALIAALGLVAFASPTAGVPFILVTDLMLTVLLLLDRDQGRVDWPVTRLLLAMGLLGAVFGSLVAVRLDDETAKVLVAAAIFVAACVAMVHEPPHWLRHAGFGAAIAFVVGVLLAAFAVGGPLIAAWLLARSTDRRTLKGTLAVFFGVIDASSLVGRSILGAVGPELIGLLMIYTIPTLTGFAVGRFLAGRLSFEIWRRLSSGGLMAIAVTGLVQTLFVLRHQFLN